MPAPSGMRAPSRMVSLRRARPVRRARVVTVVVVAGALVAGVAGVNALSGNGSRELSQGTPGVVGSVEVGDFFAASVAVGDFDGDGYGDVIAGAPFENFKKKRDVGLVHVLYGAESGVRTSNDSVIHEGAPKVAGRAEAKDLFGSAVATGDFDGDGFDDAAVGVPGEDVAGRVDAGGVTILYGSRAGLRGAGSASVNQTSTGVSGAPEAHAMFGASLAVGDFNRDGIDDLAIGAPGSGGPGAGSAGAVQVLYGTNRGLRTTGSVRLDRGATTVAGDRSAGDEFGASLAAGDFDGDGDDDLAVGVPGQAIGGAAAAGAVQVFDGSKTGIRPSTSRTFRQGALGIAGGPEPDDRFGDSLASGNFDGDRRDDLAVGVPGEAEKARSAAGKLHVLYGAKGGLSGQGSHMLGQNSKGVKTRPEAGDEFARSLASGDFDGNGRDDLAIGAPGEGFGTKVGAGVVHILYGSAKGISTTRHEWYRPGQNGVAGTSQPNAGFGRALAVGDIDGDGRADLVGGAPGQKVGRGAAAGAMTVIFG